MPRQRTLLRSTPLVRFAAAFGAVLSGCSGEAPHEAAETDGAAASQLAADADAVATLGSAAPGDVAAADLLSPDMSGGQSGGEGGGFVGIEDGPPQPCACKNGASLGKVLSLADGCAEVQVIDTFDLDRPFEVGDVLGGILDVACRGSEPFAVGDDVLFAYYPGPSDECPAVRQCYEANCIWGGVEDACRQACRDSNAETCASVGPLAWSLQTGRFSALKAEGDSVSFYFAGEEREATVSELTVPMCWTEHFALGNAYGTAGDVRLDNIEDASYDPIACFEAP